MDMKQVVPIALRVGKLSLAYFTELNNCSYWIVQCGAVNPTACRLWKWDVAMERLSHGQRFGLRHSLGNIQKKVSSFYLV